MGRRESYRRRKERKKERKRVKKRKRRRFAKRMVIIRLRKRVRRKRRKKKRWRNLITTRSKKRIGRRWRLGGGRGGRRCGGGVRVEVGIEFGFKGGRTIIGRNGGSGKAGMVYRLRHFW